MTLANEDLGTAQGCTAVMDSDGHGYICGCYLVDGGSSDYLTFYVGESSDPLTVDFTITPSTAYEYTAPAGAASYGEVSCICNDKAYIFTYIHQFYAEIIWTGIRYSIYDFSTNTWLVDNQIAVSNGAPSGYYHDRMDISCNPDNNEVCVLYENRGLKDMGTAYRGICYLKNNGGTGMTSTPCGNNLPGSTAYVGWLAGPDGSGRFYACTTFGSSSTRYVEVLDSEFDNLGDVTSVAGVVDFAQYQTSSYYHPGSGLMFVFSTNTTNSSSYLTFEALGTSTDGFTERTYGEGSPLAAWNVDSSTIRVLSLDGAAYKLADLDTLAFTTSNVVVQGAAIGGSPQCNPNFIEYPVYNATDDEVYLAEWNWYFRQITPEEVGAIEMSIAVTTALANTIVIAMDTYFGLQATITLGALGIDDKLSISLGEALFGSSYSVDSFKVLTRYKTSFNAVTEDGTEIPIKTLTITKVANDVFCMLQLPDDYLFAKSLVAKIDQQLTITHSKVYAGQTTNEVLYQGGIDTIEYSSRDSRNFIKSQVPGVPGGTVRTMSAPLFISDQGSGMSRLRFRAEARVQPLDVLEVTGYGRYEVVSVVVFVFGNIEWMECLCHG